ALSSAQRGDEIVLDAGATFTGPFRLEVKPGTAANGWITIRSSGTCPALGVKVDPARDAAQMARVVTKSVGAVFATALRASGYRLTCLEIAVDSGVTVLNTNGLVLFGDGSTAQSTLAD